MNLDLLARFKTCSLQPIAREPNFGFDEASPGITVCLNLKPTNG